MKRCEWGDFNFGQDWDESRCEAPVEVRYRQDSDSWVPGHWNYRCAKHGNYLDRSRVIVEPVKGGDA